MLPFERDALIAQRAAEIPHSTFDDHPQVVALRESAASHRATAAKLRAKLPDLSVGDLYAHIDQLREEKKAAEAQVAEVAYADLCLGDLTMARSAALRAEVARLEGVIEDLAGAVFRFTKEAPAMHAPVSAAERKAEEAEKEARELCRSLAYAQAKAEIAPGMSDGRYRG